MDVILLCAGFGTRLENLTKNTPKGLLEVAGKPVLDYLMPQVLELPELETIHLVGNGQFFAQFYTWADRWRSRLREQGIPFHLHNDGTLQHEKRLGSVGDLAFALSAQKEPRRTLIIADDTIYRFPLRPIAERFLGSDENFVLAFHEPSYQLRQRLTVLEFGKDDRVRRMHHQPEDPPTEWVSPVLYFLQPQTLSRVSTYLGEEGRERDSLARFMDYLSEHEPVQAFRMPEADTRTWFDIETKYMYNKANEVLSEEPLMVLENV